ncbi:hypothetical protein [Amycolatopsis sp. cmx-4-68]|uniref:hypothetical protein n=1 Tax=Amycolatopsis sp. cmx-4-68 TaxID=2790938 RepID=UPI00397D881B
MGETFDAVVIGAGVNGMVAAATLAKARASFCLFVKVVRAEFEQRVAAQQSAVDVVAGKRDSAVAAA